MVKLYMFLFRTFGITSVIETEKKTAGIA